MSYSNQVNFLPNPNYSGYYGPAGNCIHGNCWGHGVPSNNFGFDGSTYIDLDTLIFYIKAGDVWGVSSGGGGGVEIVTSTPVADPGTGPQIAYRQSTGEVWIWSGTSWDLVLGA